MQYSRNGGNHMLKDIAREITAHMILSRDLIEGCLTQERGGRKDYMFGQYEPISIGQLQSTAVSMGYQRLPELLDKLPVDRSTMIEVGGVGRQLFDFMIALNHIEHGDAYSINYASLPRVTALTIIEGLPEVLKAAIKAYFVNEIEHLVDMSLLEEGTFESILKLNSQVILLAQDETLGVYNMICPQPMSIESDVIRINMMMNMLVGEDPVEEVVVEPQEDVVVVEPETEAEATESADESAVEPEVHVMTTAEQRVAELEARRARARTNAPITINGVGYQYPDNTEAEAEVEAEIEAEFEAPVEPEAPVVATLEQRLADLGARVLARTPEQRVADLEARIMNEHQTEARAQALSAESYASAVVAEHQQTRHEAELEARMSPRALWRATATEEELRERMMKPRLRQIE